MPGPGTNDLLRVGGIGLACGIRERLRVGGSGLPGGEVDSGLLLAAASGGGRSSRFASATLLR